MPGSKKIEKTENAPDIFVQSRVKRDTFLDCSCRDRHRLAKGNNPKRVSDFSWTNKYTGAFCFIVYIDLLQRIFAVFDFLQLLDDTLEIFFCFFQFGRVTQNGRRMIDCRHPVTFAVNPCAVLFRDFKLRVNQFLGSDAAQADDNRWF